MSVELASELWSQLKTHISSVDRQDAAEEVVSLLIDHDYSAEEIRDEFSGDKHIKNALAHYLSVQDDTESYDDEDEDDDDYGYDDYDEDEEDEDY